MLTVTKKEIERAMANGDEKTIGFTGGVRSLDLLSLEEGDTFTLPQEYEVYRQKFGDRKVEYIWIEIGDNRAKKFYPSTFTKARTVYNEDGVSTGERVHTLGTAADLYRKEATVEKGMDALKGKTLKVTKIDTYRTLRYGSTEVVNVQIPTIDIVEPAKNNKRK